MIYSLCCRLSVDVDECQTREHNCSHNCSNTPGSFVCNCSAGYSLDLDGATCTGEHQLCSFSLVSELESVDSEKN